MTSNKIDSSFNREFQKEYILSIDQGTTSSRAVLIDSKTLEFCKISQKEHKQYYPNPGWVEHDLVEIWNNVSEAIVQVCEGFNCKNIITLGLTNQRETVCAFRKNGKPICHAIVWQDKRTSEFCKNLSDKYLNYKKITGLPLDPYFSATKIKWLLENNTEIQNANRDNDLLFGTVDTYILYRLTNGKSYFTDTTNASRTLLFNLKKCDWDDDLLRFFNISRENLPLIKNTMDDFGKSEGIKEIEGVSINALVGDQQSALVGQGALTQGEMKCTYGTGAFVLLNTGSEIIESKNGLLTTVAYTNKLEKCYALEGSSFIAGAAVQWLRDELKLISKSNEIEELAKTISSIEECRSLVFFPFFSGIGAPYWKSEAKACLWGMTRDTGKEQLAQVVLEGIAQTIADLFDAFREDFKITKNNMQSVKVDGGAASNNLLMEIQANLAGLKMIRPRQLETTVLGAALLAKSFKLDKPLKSVAATLQVDREFLEDVNINILEYYKSKRRHWRELIQRIYL